MRHSFRLHNRKRLPHFNKPGRIQVITFRLWDSIPQTEQERMETYVQTFPSEKREYYKRWLIERWLHRGEGSCLLRVYGCADVIKQCWEFCQKDGYELIAWVIMPNHVHVVVKMGAVLKIEDMVATWKSYTAHQINRQLHRKGAVWMPDFFDRYVRNNQHFSNVLTYIEKHINHGAVMWHLPETSE